MADYYQVLGVARSADTAQIRAAYKRLAMACHPDHNPGNAEAEERFKRVNEAYHVLTDPLKRSRYDNQISAYQISEYGPQIQRREEQRRRYYKMQHAQQPVYKIDGEYFRIQALSLLVFIVIAGFCVIIFHAFQYFRQQKNERHRLVNTLAIAEVKTLFEKGSVEKALTLIDTLVQKHPTDFRFLVTRDSIVRVITLTANEAYQAKEYAKAIAHYRILEHFEPTPSYDILQHLAMCQYYLGNYPEALQQMKRLLNQNPDNLVLLYNIGIIELDHLHDLEEASRYFKIGEQKFKEKLSAVYGKAFFMVMDPADAPDVYFEIVLAKARTNMMQNKYTEAILACNWAIFLRPEKGEPYTYRAVSRLKTGQRADVCEDLKLGKKYHAIGADSLIRMHCRER